MNFWREGVKRSLLTEKTDICIMKVKSKYRLIKSGGGNGPMKPGNLRKRKVPNPAKQSKDEDREFVPCRSRQGVFVPQKKG